MIQNALLISSRTPAGPDGSGGRVAGTITEIGVRVYLSAPTNAQILSMANKVADASAVMKVPIDQAGSIIDGGRVTVKPDVGSQANYQVLKTRDFIKGGGLSHKEVWLKGL